MPSSRSRQATQSGSPATRPYRDPLPPELALEIIDSDIPAKLDLDVRRALGAHIGSSDAFTAQAA